MAKKKHLGKALLSSAVAMLMTGSMFVGSTFAWFTDSVTSNNNVIKSGNLDVTLEYLAKDGKTWNDVEGASDILTNLLWEPGVTEVAYMRIKNAGSLALKYQFGVNVVSETAGVNVAGEKFLLSDYIYFDTETTNSETFAPFATRAEAMEIVDEPTKISQGFADNGTLAAKSDYVYISMVVYMPTTVGNVANHNGVNVPQIDLGINVVATQVEAELDSFDDKYDANRMVTVEEGDNLAAAIAQVDDGGTVYVEPGVYNLTNGQITLTGKTVNVVGIGNVTLVKQFGNAHVFTVSNGSTLNLENLTIDGNGNTREGVYVRWNSKLNLKNVTIKNTGGKDIMVDEASDAVTHGQTTTSCVKLVNSHIEDIAMCASPVTTVAATQDTFVKFEYDAKSTIGAIEKQSINRKPENIFINDSPFDENGEVMNLYVTDDDELDDALATISGNEAYWDKQVFVYLAAGEYSGDHVINQYPTWNGITGGGASGNNLTNVNDVDKTFITFVGETVSTFASTSVPTPAVTFTGNVTLNGFGYSGGGFDAAVATTTFENVCFDGANSADEEKDEDAVVMYVKAAANNVTFKGCTFQNATHVTLGGSKTNGVGKVTVDGCYFNNGGCLSGYFETLNVVDTVVAAADNGFINKSKGGDVTVEKCDVTAGKYFLRTSNSGVNVTVTDTAIKMYESEGEKNLVNFRGSDESVSFTDCKIAAGYTLAGVDANSNLDVYANDKSGVTYVDSYVDIEKSVKSLYLVPADFAADTVEVAEGVEAIGNYAFAYNTNVKTVELASTVRDLGRGFDSAPSVEKVVLNEGLETISSRAFKSTASLEEVVFSSTVKTIADNAFQKSGIKSITIPATVETVGETAFGASLIEEVIFEGNTSIQGYAFRGCTKLRRVYLYGDDVTLIPSTLSGKNSCWFCNSESNNPKVSTIAFYVVNETVENRIKTAMGVDKEYVTYHYIKSVTTAEELKAAITGAVDGDVILLANDITITDKWDERYGGRTAKSIIIDGNGHTLKFTGEVHDGNNYHSVFRFEGSAVVKNLTFDMSEVVKGSAARMRAITATGNLTVNNCTFIGNDAYTADEAIVIGEGHTVAQNAISVRVTNCTFNNWRRGVSDNESGTREIKSFVISGNTFNNAEVNVSAYECVTFTNNVMVGNRVSITSYTNAANVVVVVTGNVLDASYTKYPNQVGTVNQMFTAANVTVQEGMTVYAN